LRHRPQSIPKIATAGAHFLQKAKFAGDAIGLAQINEILSVPDVVLVGPYPGELQTLTTYPRIVLTRTPNPDAAEAFLRFPLSPPVRTRFKQSGYEPPAR
jgi:ABC-type molybdate transport system substrate-binding protein